MRKLALAQSMTLDGLVQSPDEWQCDHFDDKLADVASRVDQRDAVER